MQNILHQEGQDVPSMCPGPSYYLWIYVEESTIDRKELQQTISVVFGFRLLDLASIIAEYFGNRWKLLLQEPYKFEDRTGYNQPCDWVTSVALQYLLQRYPLVQKHERDGKVDCGYAHTEPNQLIPETRVGLPVDTSINLKELSFRAAYDGITWANVDEFNIDDILKGLTLFLQREPERLTKGYGHDTLCGSRLWRIIRVLQKNKRLHFIV